MSSPLLTTEPYKLCPEAGKLFKSINEEWAQIQERREKSNAEDARLSAIDPADFSPVQMKARRVWREERIGILQGEVAVLRRWKTKWPEVRHLERARAHNEAIAELEAAQAKVVKALESIGYRDVGPDGVFVNAHPSIEPIAVRVFELQSLAGNGFAYEAAEKTIAQRETELRSLLAQAA
jgi:hypothetical protein